MKNSVLDELDKIMYLYYAFWKDEKDKWKMLMNKYEYLKYEPINNLFYFNIKEMLREMNDAHLTINYQNSIIFIPDILISIIDGEFFVVADNKLFLLQKINDKPIKQILDSYKQK